MVNLIQKLESKMNNKVRKSLGVLSYRLLNGYALSPRNVIFEVTHRCNERCKMCLFYSEEGIKPYSKPEISLHKIEKIVSDIC